MSQTNAQTQIVLDRRASSSLSFADTSTFTNDFPGIDAVLNNKNAYPIDLQAALNPRFLAAESVNDDVRKLFRKKKDTILAIDSFWVNGLQYYRNLHGMNIQDWDNHLTKFESTIYQYLKTLGLWHDQMEILLILVKFWVWKSGNKEKVLRYESLLFTFASLDWYSILAPLIRSVFEYSLAFRYQTDTFLNGTNFTGVATMLHTCWLIINTVINCSRFDTSYSPFNDHGIFVSLLKQCNPIDSYLDHIVYFLKFGPINYLVQPARRELEQLLPRNVSTRLFYYELLRLSGHLIAQSMYEFKIWELENEADAEHFGYQYFVRQDGINYMWPTAVDDYEPLRLQSMNMAHAKDSKFFSFTTLQHCTNQHIIDGGMKILRELVSKNSIISTYMLDTPLCRTSSDHIQHLCVGLFEYQFWMVLPDELQELYFAMISVKGYQYELFLDRSFLIVASGTKLHHFRMCMNWVYNKSGKSQYAQPIFIYMHFVLRSLFISMLESPWRRPVATESNPNGIYWPEDLIQHCHDLYRNWFLFHNQEYSRFVFGLHRIFESLWCTDGPYNELNPQVFNEETFKERIDSIFNNDNNKDNFFRTYDQWKEEQKLDNIIFGPVSQCYETLKHTLLPITNNSRYAASSVLDIRAITNGPSSPTPTPPPPPPGSPIPQAPSIANTPPRNPCTITDNTQQNNNDDSKQNNNQLTQENLDQLAQEYLAPRGTRSVAEYSESAFTTATTTLTARGLGNNSGQRPNATKLPMERLVQSLGMNECDIAALLNNKDDVPSEFAGSVTTATTVTNVIEEDHDSKMEVMNTKGGTSIRQQYNFNMQQAQQSKDYRQMPFGVFRCDYKGIHDSQTNVIPFRVSAAPLWSNNSWNVNYLCTLMDNNVAWLYLQPFHMPAGDFVDNRKVEKKASWITGYNDFGVHVSECGQHETRVDYQLLLINADSPVLYVQSGLLKFKGKTLREFRDEVSIYCDNLHIKYFPNLKYGGAPASFIKHVENEMTWASSVLLFDINNDLESRNQQQVAIETNTIGTQQSIFERTLSCHFIYLQWLSQHSQSILNATILYQQLLSEINKGLTSKHGVHEYNYVRVDNIMAGNSYQLLTEAELSDTLGFSHCPIIYDDFKYTIKRLIKCLQDFVNNQLNLSDAQSNFVYQRQIDDIINTFHNLRVTSPILFLELNIQKYYLANDTIIWFANPKAATPQLKREQTGKKYKSVNLNKWLIDIENTFDKNGVPTSAGANKFLGKFGFIPCVKIVIDNNGRINLKGLIQNVRRMWYIFNTISFVILDETKSNYIKLNQYMSYFNQVYNIIVNVIQQMSTRCGLNVKNGW